MWKYSEKLMEHFKNPRNVGEIEAPDAVGEVGNLVCGDALKLTLRIDGKTGTITDAKFQTFGCASAIASSSVLTEMIKGKTIEQAEQMTNKDIADFLGGMPEEKLHCSVMGMEALEKAIAGYRGISPAGDTSDEGKIVCKCFSVTDRKILRAIEESGLRTVEEVTNYTKAGGGCGRCKGDIERLITGYWEGKSGADRSREMEEELSKKKETDLETLKKVQETINREVRPRLKADGGDIELVDVKHGKVFVRFLGTCLGCRSADLTLHSLVESKVKEFVSDNMKVEEVRE